MPPGREKARPRVGTPHGGAGAAGLSDSLASLVRQGLENHAGKIGLEGVGPIEWLIDARLDRPLSTVYRLHASLGASDRVGLYLKIFRVPSHRPELEVRLHDRVVRTRWVAERMGEMADTTSLGVPDVLASDVDALAILFLEVGGDPLGKAWRHLVSGRWRRAEETFVRVGRAIRVFEDLSLGVAEPTGYLDRVEVEQAVDKVIPHLSSAQSQRARRVVSALYEDYAEGPRASYYCHGDINHANVLVDHQKVNLIDFDLSSRPRTFDLSMFLLRLEMERPSLASWTDKVSEWVIEGYGEPDVRSKPAFSLIRLIKLSGGISRNANRRKVDRFVASLEETLTMA